MNAIKAVYMPFRRVFLDDDEVVHPDDIPWIISMSTLTVGVLVICQIATCSN